MVHNGFPKPPFDADELGVILDSLGREGIVRYYRTGKSEDDEAIFQPSVEEIQLALSMPAARPSNSDGRLMITLSDSGSHEVEKRLDESGVTFDKNFGSTRNEVRVVRTICWRGFTNGGQLGLMSSV